MVDRVVWNNTPIPEYSSEWEPETLHGHAWFLLVEPKFSSDSMIFNDSLHHVCFVRPTPMYPPSYMEPGMGWVHLPSPVCLSGSGNQIGTVVGQESWLCWWMVLWMCYRRHTPYGNQTDYRIFELNKRLQNWTEVRRYFGTGHFWDAGTAAWHHFRFIWQKAEDSSPDGVYEHKTLTKLSLMSKHIFPIMWASDGWVDWGWLMG